MFPSFCVRIELRIFGECLVSPKVLSSPFLLRCVLLAYAPPPPKIGKGKERDGISKDVRRHRFGSFLSLFLLHNAEEREREKGRLFIRLSTEMTWFPFFPFPDPWAQPFPNHIMYGDTIRTIPPICKNTHVFVGIAMFFSLSTFWVLERGHVP